ncbi:MAG: type II toxin-antitoxin system ParD family antitoxin [Phycisphaerales bacterium]|nr:type II toxin-antitoxin system ParD family antitoxin [Phycisphaerales bacterium]
MTSMNISLPEEMKAFVDAQLSRGAYSSVSEYVRELIRQAQRRSAQERLENRLLDGLDSGEPVPVTPAFWDNRRKKLAANINGRERGAGERGKPVRRKKAK